MNSIAGVNALKAYDIRQQVNANNVANVNTDGFKPSRATMEETEGQNGVRVQEIRKEDENLRTQRNRENERSQQEQKEPSRTDLVTEFTQMIENKNAYNANAQAIKVNDQMTGEILNKLV